MDTLVFTVGNSLPLLVDIVDSRITQQMSTDSAGCFHWTDVEFVVPGSHSCRSIAASLLEDEIWIVDTCTNNLVESLEFYATPFGKHCIAHTTALVD